MREQILNLLRTRFEGVGEKVLGRIADKLAKTATTEQEAKTSVEGLTLQQVCESYADSRATEAQQTAVANYEKKHGLRDGKPAAPAPAPQPAKAETEPKPGTPTPGSDLPEWARALVESNKKLEAQLTAMQGEKRTATRRQQIDDITAKLPESLRKAYSHLALESLSDQDFDTLRSEVEGEVSAIAADTAARGAVFGRPTVKGGSATQRTESGQGEATDQEVSEIVDRLVK